VKASVETGLHIQENCAQNHTHLIKFGMWGLLVGLFAGLFAGLWDPVSRKFSDNVTNLLFVLPMSNRSRRIDLSFSNQRVNAKNCPYFVIG